MPEPGEEEEYLAQEINQAHLYLMHGRGGEPFKSVCRIPVSDHLMKHLLNETHTFNIRAVERDFERLEKLETLRDRPEGVILQMLYQIKTRYDVVKLVEALFPKSLDWTTESDDMILEGWENINLRFRTEEERDETTKA